MQLFQSSFKRYKNLTNIVKLYWKKDIFKKYLQPKNGKFLAEKFMIYQILWKFNIYNI